MLKSHSSRRSNTRPIHRKDEAQWQHFSATIQYRNGLSSISLIFIATNFILLCNNIYSIRRPPPPIKHSSAKDKLEAISASSSFYWPNQIKENRNKNNFLTNILISHRKRWTGKAINCVWPNEEQRRAIKTHTDGMIRLEHQKSQLFLVTFATLNPFDLAHGRRTIILTFWRNGSGTINRWSSKTHFQ